jgi:hypothetical protein
VEGGGFESGADESGLEKVVIKLSKAVAKHASSQESERFKFNFCDGPRMTIAERLPLSNDGDPDIAKEDLGASPNIVRPDALPNSLI